MKTLSSMLISDIISRHYDTLKKEVNGEKVISHSKTSEDLLQDVCLTALRKYKNTDITEEEGLSYLKKTLFTEKHFSWNRKKTDILVYMENIPDIHNN